MRAADVLGRPDDACGTVGLATDVEALEMGGLLSHSRSVCLITVVIYQFLHESFIVISQLRELFITTCLFRPLTLLHVLCSDQALMRRW
jgi:hypothetical protein